jgi:hypothetical protein
MEGVRVGGEQNRGSRGRTRVGGSSDGDGVGRRTRDVAVERGHVEVGSSGVCEPEPTADTVNGERR